MDLRPAQADEEHLDSSHYFPCNQNPLLCHPERSRGICSSADLSWKRLIPCSNRIVISTGAYPDFLPRSTRNDRVCGFQ
jgi:hypothetical protein